MTSKKDAWLEFSQNFWFERFLTQPLFTYRKMFGGLALYLDGRMVAVIAESLESDTEARTWRGKDYGFVIWNGILFPTERVHHPSLLSQWNELLPHPVLPKWLYLPQSSSRFEVIMPMIATAILKRDPRFGIEPKSKKKKKKK